MFDEKKKNRSFPVPAALQCDFGHDYVGAHLPKNRNTCFRSCRCLVERLTQVGFPRQRARHAS
jgi:hypothetical protein